MVRARLHAAPAHGLDDEREEKPVFDHQLTIRLTGPGEERALQQLADLDSQPHLRGGALIAEVDGEPVAAIGLDSGAVVANPFRPTAGVVRLLEDQRRALQANAPATGDLWSTMLRILRFARPVHDA